MAQRKKRETKRKTNKTNTTHKQKSPIPSHILYEVIVIGFVALSLFLTLSIYLQQGGIIGKLVRDICFGLYGIGSYLLPVYILLASFAKIFNRKNQRLDNKIILFFFLIITVSTFSHLVYIESSQLMKEIMGESAFFPTLVNYFSLSAKHKIAGGFIGGFFGDLLALLLGRIGSYIITILIFISLIILITEQSLFSILQYIAIKIKNISKKIYSKVKEVIQDQRLKNYNKVPREDQKKNNENPNEVLSKEKNDFQNSSEHINSTSIQEQDAIQISFFKEKEEKKVDRQNDKQVSTPSQVQNIEQEISENPTTKSNKSLYEYPPLDLLRDNPVTGVHGSKMQLKRNAEKLEQTLLSFGVGAKVINVSCGPTITRYELQPEQGVKVSKIVNLTDDIALNLAAAGIRMEAPIPGKSLIGIEVPNKDVRSVFIKEVIDTETFKKFPSKIAFALGKDISGETIIADIARMPHMLISGATGSGKSVCINTLITSILFRAHPEEVKLLMIDPKVVELKVYNGIPHLLIPVVTDPKKAAGALYWAVQEMSERYQLFANTNVRDLSSYNRMVAEKKEGKKLPQIVIIVDELADLMQVAAKDVEEAICRLAQMARAAGIHLILATQRPSVDVITGVIKANIPSRIAFSVSSGTDSRTIIDMNGAEKLIGKGDMLYYPVGFPKPVRIQGAFITDKEVEKIVEFLKASQEADYDDQIMDQIVQETDSNSLSNIDDEKDEYFEQALELVIEKQKASASMIQRRFRVGYNRAARIVDQLNEAGFVGPEEGSKPRKVNLTWEEYYALKQEAKSANTNEEMAATKEEN